MRKGVLALMLAGAAIAAPAEAASYLFSLSELDFDGNVRTDGNGDPLVVWSMTVDSDPVPDAVYEGDWPGFAITAHVWSADWMGNVTEGDGTVIFYTQLPDGQSGGFEDYVGNRFTYGPQLFTGPLEAPTFRLGTFIMTDWQFNPITSLTISVAEQPSPTPEPASWGMMVAGFGALGAGMRARRRVGVPFG